MEGETRFSHTKTGSPPFWRLTRRPVIDGGSEPFCSRFRRYEIYPREGLAPIVRISMAQLM
jgi:hypothetical protein